jgi:hypothetical protein
MKQPCPKAACSRIGPPDRQAAPPRRQKPQGPAAIGKIFIISATLTDECYAGTPIACIDGNDSGNGEATDGCVFRP